MNSTDKVAKRKAFEDAARKRIRDEQQKAQEQKRKQRMQRELQEQSIAESERRAQLVSDQQRRKWEVVSARQQHSEKNEEADARQKVLQATISAQKAAQCKHKQHQQAQTTKQTAAAARHAVTLERKRGAGSQVVPDESAGGNVSNDDDRSSDGISCNSKCNDHRSNDDSTHNDGNDHVAEDSAGRQHLVDGERWQSVVSVASYEGCFAVMLGGHLSIEALVPYSICVPGYIHIW